MKGKVAIVTGASRGIGKAIAEALAAEGAKVACVSSSGAAEETAELLRAQGAEAIGLRCDVGDASQVETTVAAVIDAFGSVDILVNNAGITRDTLLLRMTDEDWNEVMRVNAKGPFNMTRAALRPMMKARWGRIVNVTSIVGLSGQAGQANYAASKAAIVGLTKSVAKEFGSRGITCNAVAPGFIETDMTRDLSDDMRQSILAQAPASRLGKPEDIAAAVTFLAGEQASYITGQVLVVDGGLTV
ncbi:MAG: 3-oxoacyl-[acyl-carrier-protein] reductase [Fimbriimonadales bacterium]|nr:3-oxoacyl-[acyl-carrier-protein] reductase [Fimbriimonadales bacterium]